MLSSRLHPECSSSLNVIFIVMFFFVWVAHTKKHDGERARAEVLARVQPKPRRVLNQLQGKSESRGWNYARFLISSPGSIWFSLHGANNPRGVGSIRIRESTSYSSTARVLLRLLHPRDDVYKRGCPRPRPAWKARQDLGLQRE